MDGADSILFQGISTGTDHCYNITDVECRRHQQYGKEDQLEKQMDLQF